jgi:site-specific DNA-cytosine methylase
MDGKSKLFWEFVRVLKETNPTYFLLENVRMKKEWENIITEQLGVKPILINSRLVSAQNRPRLYWTNIPNIEQPLDRGLLLKDILQETWDDKFNLSEKACDYMSRLRNGKPRWEYHTNPLNGKSACLTANMYKGVPYGVIKEQLRRLTPVECERLQTVPDNYTAGVSDTQRFKMLGNGWTIDVIAHILMNMKYYEPVITEKQLELI